MRFMPPRKKPRIVTDDWFIISHCVLFWNFHIGLNRINEITLASAVLKDIRRGRGRVQFIFRCWSVVWPNRMHRRESGQDGRMENKFATLVCESGLEKDGATATTSCSKFGNDSFHLEAEWKEADANFLIVKLWKFVRKFIAHPHQKWGVFLTAHLSQSSAGKLPAYYRQLTGKILAKCHHGVFLEKKIIFFDRAPPLPAR